MWEWNTWVEQNFYSFATEEIKYAVSAREQWDCQQRLSEAFRTVYQHHHHQEQHSSLSPFFYWYTQEEKDLNKKVKYGPEESPVNPDYMSYVCDPMSAYWYPTIASQWSRISAFRPWSPVVDKDGKPILNQAMPQQSAYFRDNNSQTLPSYLSRGPPVLLNPERVVPNSETERFERHYQPNVALAPPTAQQISQKIRLSLAANALMINSSRERRIIPNNITAKVMNPEMEMSTDTDETLSDSTTNAESIDYQYEIIGDGTKNNSLEDNNKVDEIESLRKLMEANKIGAAPQQEIVQEVEKIRKKDKVEAEAAKKEKNALQQELEYVKMSKREKLREATEAKRHLRKQLQQMDEEHSAQMKEQMLVQKQLRSQLAAALGIKQEASETNSRGKKVVKNESPIEDIAAAGGKVMNEPNVKMEKERD